jgi:hypothetical protein
VGRTETGFPTPYHPPPTTRIIIEADWTLPASTRPIRQSSSQNSKWRSEDGFGLERLPLTFRFLAVAARLL